MCGITGFFRPSGLDPHDAVALVRRMASTLIRRGPDDEGAWSDERQIALGFRRLAIVDLSELGRQPMRSASGRYVVVFNGEIYNHNELRGELEARGHTFRGRSDTEVLLASIESHGFAATLPMLRGMFAIACWDAETRALFLARDPLGEKPLYVGWGRGGKTLLFGSELKALRVHPDFDASDAALDRGSLVRYLRHGYVSGRQSIYSGIERLPPGTWARIDGDPARAGAPLEPTPYYSMRAVAEAGLAAPMSGSLDDAADALDHALRAAIGEQMLADVPVGAFLSGGIDSSLITMVMQALSPRPIRTYSIGFDVARYDESTYARAVATALGTAHTEFKVTAADALALIPELPQIYDEPFADSSQLPTTLVSRLARREVTVALTGDGGDELFAGYPRYTVLRRLAPAFAIPGRRTVADLVHRALAAVNRGGAVASTDRRLLDWALRRSEVARSIDADDFYRLQMSVWHHPEVLVPGTVEPRGVMPLAKDVLAQGNATERAMYADLMHNFPDALLVKVDRAAMSASLETRLPLLDKRVIELAWRIPFHHKVDGARCKLVMRQLLARRMPASLFDRPKMGFMIPIVDWLRGPLRPWAEELLSERSLREDGFLEPTLIRRRWHGFLAGTRDWQGSLWPVLMWQAWRAQTRATR